MTRRLTLAALALLIMATAAFAATEQTGPLTKVDPKTVCMVNEQAMGRPQIPVEVDGKTYYGCCAMCKKALAENAASRKATDPLTGKEVDKAVAVIAAGEDGRVFYFATEKNLEKYNEKLRARK